jgi:CrcB protein
MSALDAYAVWWLAAGSVAGGLARYWLTGAVHRWHGTSFPAGTFAVNMTGCFLIGFFDAMAGERFALGPGGRLLLMTGFCGAFTTFSTLILETANQMRGGEFSRALLNTLGSVLLGLILFRLGALAGKHIP